MAAALKKHHRSHRRIAAVNFLSNIPLDVNCKDSKFSFLQIGAISSQNEELSRTDSADSVPQVAGLDRDDVAVVEEDGDPDSEPPEQSVTVHSTGSTKHRTVSSFKTRTPRPTSVDVGQLNNRGVISHSTDVIAENQSLSLTESGRDDVHESEDDFVLELQPSIQAAQPRHGSVSGERDRLKFKKKLQSSFSAENAGIFPSDFGERKRHRSSSLSTDSGDSGPSRQHSHSGTHKEIRFLHARTEKRIKNGRIVILSNERVPIVVHSTLPYTKHKKQLINEPDSAAARRVSSIQRPVSTSHEGLLTFGLSAMEFIEEGQDISYSQFLVPSRHKGHHRRTVTHDSVSSSASQENSALAAGLPVQLFRSISYDPSLSLKSGHQTPPVVFKEKGFDYDMTSDLIYDPNMLDDPELSSGKHRTLLTFTSYMTSIIDYCRPSELKSELNEKFREKFPHISLTLSKLRSLKREMRKIGHAKCSIDLWTVAQAYVFYEKLILKGLVNKPNRKLCAGASLLLSAKLNDIKKSDLTKLIDEIEDNFKVQRRELLAFEVAILIALEFTLHIPDYEVYPHYQRLMYQS